MPASPTPAGTPSASAVTIRGLAPDLKARLRIRAAHNDRSMEAEARAILEAALAAPEEDPTDLAAFAHGLFAPLGGIDLELPSREPVRDPPTFTGGGESPVTPDKASRKAAKGAPRRAGTAGRKTPAKTGRHRG
jgi:plasmid stability protein